MNIKTERKRIRRMADKNIQGPKEEMSRRLVNKKKRAKRKEKKKKCNPL